MSSPVFIGDIAVVVKLAHSVYEKCKLPVLHHTTMANVAVDR